VAPRTTQRDVVPAESSPPPPPPPPSSPHSFEGGVRSTRFHAQITDHPSDDNGGSLRIIAATTSRQERPIDCCRERRRASLSITEKRQCTRLTPSSALSPSHHSQRNNELCLSFNLTHRDRRGDIDSLGDSACLSFSCRCSFGYVKFKNIGESTT
jgi:hypothetical protein